MGVTAARYIPGIEIAEVFRANGIGLRLHRWSLFPSRFTITY